MVAAIGQDFQSHCSETSQSSKSRTQTMTWVLIHIRFIDTEASLKRLWDAIISGTFWRWICEKNKDLKVEKACKLNTKRWNKTLTDRAKGTMVSWTFKIHLSQLKCRLHKDGTGSMAHFLTLPLSALIKQPIAVHSFLFLSASADTVGCSRKSLAPTFSGQSNLISGCSVCAVESHNNTSP